MRRGVREAALVGAATTLILVFIGVVSMAEEPPPPLGVHLGASPANSGPIGTQELVILAKDLGYGAVVVGGGRWSVPRAAACVYVVVSPGTPYTASEGSLVLARLRESCGRVSFLVADESVTSNGLLEAIGSSVRVEGSLLTDPLKGPYPEALLTLPGPDGAPRAYRVVLDKASPLLVGGAAEILGVSVGEPVAAYEPTTASGASALVLGDGSILLNQALRSNGSYRELAADIIRLLCGWGEDCVVAFDASHYELVEVSPSDPAALVFTDPLTLAAMTAAKLLHPSSWLPPLLERVRAAVEEVSGSPTWSPVAALAGGLAAYAVLARKLGGARLAEEELGEQEEVEFYLYSDLREAVSRRPGLTKRDFVTVFRIVDGVLKAVTGVGLCSEGSIEVLARALGSPDAASKYRSWMCRAYSKAVGRSLLPLILSWGRATRRAIRESEEVLRALGYSLMKEKGVEYVVARGG